MPTIFVGNGQKAKILKETSRGCLVSCIYFNLITLLSYFSFSHFCTDIMSISYRAYTIKKNSLLLSSSRSSTFIYAFMHSSHASIKFIKMLCHLISCMFKLLGISIDHTSENLGPSIYPWYYTQSRATAMAEDNKSRFEHMENAH